jgi:lipid A disaccharide synthetase
MPLSLAIAQHLHNARPQTRFVIPVAPTVDLATLAKFADPTQNPVSHCFENVAAQLINDPVQPFLQTHTGVRLDLWIKSPAYDLLKKCRLCFTTVGANTAELGSLALPMIVLLPTQQMDAMRSWDGLPGILANLPIVGSWFTVGINHLARWWFMRQGRLFAWPNIWAGEEIVPEIIGQLDPEKLAALALDWLETPEKLAQMRDRLQQVRGKPGAAKKLAQLVKEII